MCVGRTSASDQEEERGRREAECMHNDLMRKAAQVQTVARFKVRDAHTLTNPTNEAHNTTVCEPVSMPISSSLSITYLLALASGLRRGRVAADQSEGDCLAPQIPSSSAHPVPHHTITPTGGSAHNNNEEACRCPRAIRSIL